MKLKTREDVDKVLAEISGDEFNVDKVEKKRRNVFRPTVSRLHLCSRKQREN